MEEQQYETVKYKITAAGTPTAETIVLTKDGMQVTAFWSRMVCGCGLDGRFDPLVVLEHIIPSFDRTFNYQIADAKSWQWGASVSAIYFPAGNKIVIRSDVYDGAHSRNPIDIITITHEIVHYVQFLVKNLLASLSGIRFTTELCAEGSAEMRRHESQTDEITAMVLCPERLTEGKSREEIIQNYIVGPLVQFSLGLTKAAGKSLLRLLAETETKRKEVAICAV